VHRLGRLDRVAKVAVVDRHAAPAEQDQALVRYRLLDGSAHDGEADLVARHEQVPDAVAAGLGQCDSDGRALLREEPVRDLHEDAAAVPHLRVGADGPAMIEISQGAEPLLDDGVRLAVLHVGDEAHPAGVLLVGRIVEPLLLGKAGIAHHEAPIGSLGGGRAFARRGAEIVRSRALLVAAFVFVPLLDPRLTHRRSLASQDTFAHWGGGSGCPE
jgi:hypothetical protein